MFRKATRIAALFSTGVLGLGQAVVRNQCDFGVFVRSVSDKVGGLHSLAPNRGYYQEIFRINPNGGGISIKISRDAAQSQITQFEYTLDEKLWYDVSNINGYPFADWGLSLVPSNNVCRTVFCAAGVAECTEVYNEPTDDYATSACDVNSDLVLSLCPPGVVE